MTPARFGAHDAQLVPRRSGALNRDAGLPAERSRNSKPRRHHRGNESLEVHRARSNDDRHRGDHMPFAIHNSSGDRIGPGSEFFTYEGDSGMAAGREFAAKRRRVDVRLRGVARQLRRQYPLGEARIGMAEEHLADPRAMQRQSPAHP